MYLVRNVLIILSLLGFVQRAQAAPAEATCVLGATQFNVQAFAVAFHSLATTVRDAGGAEQVQNALPPSLLDPASSAVMKLYQFGTKGGKCLLLTKDEALGVVLALVVMSDYVGKHSLDKSANANFIADAGSEEQAKKFLAAFDVIGGALAEHGGMHSQSSPAPHKDMGI